MKLAVIKRYLPAMLLLLAIAVVMPLIRQVDGRAGAVAVVFGPGIDLPDAFSRVVAAGGYPLAAGPVGTVVVARFNEGDYAERIRDLGAWLLLAPLIAGCGTLPDSQSAGFGGIDRYGLS